MKNHIDLVLTKENFLIWKSKDLSTKDIEKGKEGEFTFNLNPESELATKHKSADTTITIRKTLDGNKLGLKATINVPKIVKDTEYIPWKDDEEAFLKKEVEKKWQITKEEKATKYPLPNISMCISPYVNKPK